MAVLKKIFAYCFNFLTFSNLWIAIGSFVFTLQTQLVFDATLPASNFFAWTNFVATFCLYTIQRLYTSTKHSNSERMQWYLKNRKALFTLMAVFILLYFSFFIKHFVTFKEGIIAYGFVSLLSVFYFIPPFHLRAKPYLKIFIIGFVWTTCAVIIPLMYRDYTFVLFENINAEEFYYILAQFLFISALCIPFDIRDVKNDRQDSIKTLPVHFGISTAKKIGFILLVIYILLANDGKQFIAYFVSGLLGILLTVLSNDRRHPYYFSVLVDGLIIVQFALYVFLFAGN